MLVVMLEAAMAATASAVSADVTMVSTDLRGRVGLVRAGRDLRVLVAAMASPEVRVVLVMAPAATDRIARAVRIETIGLRVATSMVRDRLRVGHSECNAELVRVY
jgi:hypothetical protein